ncbi:hypothetical protein JCM15908A_12610 [Prevotella dentasini JCM 15908]
MPELRKDILRDSPFLSYRGPWACPGRQVAVRQRQVLKAVAPPGDSPLQVFSRLVLGQGTGRVWLAPWQAEETAALMQRAGREAAVRGGLQLQSAFAYQ